MREDQIRFRKAKSASALYIQVSGFRAWGSGLCIHAKDGGIRLEGLGLKMGDLSHLCSEWLHCRQYWLV